MACWERFTTYESTEERMLPILIRKKARYGATKASLKTMLAFISKTIKDLSKETKKLVAQADKLDRHTPRRPRPLGRVASQGAVSGRIKAQSNRQSGS